MEDTGTIYKYKMQLAGEEGGAQPMPEKAVEEEVTESELPPSPATAEAAKVQEGNTSLESGEEAQEEVPVEGKREPPLEGAGEKEGEGTTESKLEEGSEVKEQSQEATINGSS